MEISELTGLPELPEGYFWRVGESRSDFLSVFTRPKYAYVAIMHRKTVQKTQDKVIHLPFGIEFTWGYETVEEETTETILSFEIVRTEKVLEDFYGGPEDEKLGVKEVDKVTYLTGDDLTPELILNAARKCFDRWGEIIKSNDLLGDYPPKKLNQENNK